MSPPVEGPIEGRLAEKDGLWVWGIKKSSGAKFDCILGERFDSNTPLSVGCAEVAVLVLGIGSDCAS